MLKKYNYNNNDDDVDVLLSMLYYYKVYVDAHNKIYQ